MLPPAVNVMVNAARLGGNVLLRHINRLDALNGVQKQRMDYASEVDEQAEKAVIKELRKAYPDAAFLGEEGGAQGKGNAVFVIDPLDGTTNYLHGHPQYAISMALLHKGKLQEALVYAPERNDCYMASRGQGALRNDRRIRVSNRIELNRCLIGTGFPVVDQSMMDTYLAILKDFLAKTAGGRREGAGCSASWVLGRKGPCLSPCLQCRSFRQGPVCGRRRGEEAHAARGRGACRHDQSEVREYGRRGALFGREA